MHNDDDAAEDDGPDDDPEEEGKAEAEEEADDSDTEDEAAEESHGDQTEEDEAEDGGRPPRRSLSSRLPKKPVFEANNDTRTIESLRQRVDEIAASIAAAKAEVASLPQPAALTATLREYQLEGFRWAVALESCGHSGILGDEMGLGKTLQAIALFAHLHAAGAVGTGAVGAGAARFLVLAPLSTLAGWGAQLADFCPSATVVLYSGGAAEREARRRALLAPPAAGAFEVCLASYEVLLLDAPQLKPIVWRAVVVDEAHRLKNRSSALYRCLLDELELGGTPRLLLTGTPYSLWRHSPWLDSPWLDSPWLYSPWLCLLRLLLTGTPLQNSGAELFSLLHFIAPTAFDAAALFEEALAADADAARPLWAPLLLRRLKADHVTLPAKVEAVLYVPLTKLQREWYRAVLERDARQLGAASARSLNNVLASLRNCCNHPYLFDGAEPEPFVEGEHLVAASAKLALLDRLLRRLRARGDKVLLF